MHFKFNMLSSLISALLLFNFQTQTQAQSKISFNDIKICDDMGEWPPYTFYERDQSGGRTTKIVGFTIDTMKQIMKKYNINYTLELLPWARCLEAVKNYDDKYSLILNLSSNPKREAEYYLTNSYYKNTPVVFYSKKTHKNGLNLVKLEDLKKYKACGVAEYNYGPLGYKPGEIDTGAKSIPQAVDKVKENRCDLVPANVEIAAGFKQTEKIDLLHDPEIGYQVLSMKPPVYYVMAVSRNNPQGKQLQEMLNKEFAEMEKNGEFAKLAKKWIGE